MYVYIYMFSNHVKSINDKTRSHDWPFLGWFPWFLCFVAIGSKISSAMAGKDGKEVGLMFTSSWVILGVSSLVKIGKSRVFWMAFLDLLQPLSREVNGWFPTAALWTFSTVKHNAPPGMNLVLYNKVTIKLYRLKILSSFAARPLKSSTSEWHWKQQHILSSHHPSDNTVETAVMAR